MKAIVKDDTTLEIIRIIEDKVALAGFSNVSRTEIFEMIDSIEDGIRFAFENKYPVNLYKFCNFNINPLKKSCLDHRELYIAENNIDIDNMSNGTKKDLFKRLDQMIIERNDKVNSGLMTTNLQKILNSKKSVK